MKLVIEVDVEKLPQDMSVMNRYFGKTLHRKVVDALETMGVTLGEDSVFDYGRKLFKEGKHIGRIGFD